MLSSDSDSEDEILLLLALWQTKNKKSKRIWVHDINKKREIFGEFHHLCQELTSYEDRFYTYFHMSKNSFEELHDIIQPRITKQDTNWRRAISTKERLSICLRYLTTGDSYKTIAFSYRVGRTTVSEIIKQVTNAVWEELQPIYMPTPTENTWRESEIGYRTTWNFPNCVGSVDGKHIPIQCPGNSGSDYYCYKNMFSIVLLAVVDPYYKFIVVDIGSYGRHSDSGIFENSEFYKIYLMNKTLLPPKPLPNTNDLVPHVIIGDEGFGLKPYLMRPYPKTVSIVDERKRKFNFRLSRARRVVENVFGQLTQKFQVFKRPMQCSVETAIDVVKATCCLHNFIKTKHGNRSHEIEADFQPQEVNSLLPISHTNQRASNFAMEIREKFVNYFNDN